MASGLFSGVKLYNVLGVRNLGIVRRKEWEEKYIRFARVSPALISMVKSFYRRYDTNMTCREIVMAHIKAGKGLSVTWGDSQVEVSEEFMKLLLPVIIDLMDSMMKFGFAVWNVVPAEDSEGNRQLIPNIVDPEDGIICICTKPDNSTEMCFTSSILQTKEGETLQYPVYTFPNRGPEVGGELRSPIGGVIFHGAYYEFLQNLDAATAVGVATPTIITQHKDDVLLDRRIFDGINIAPPAVGGAAVGAAMGPYGMPLPNDSRNAVQREKELDMAEEDLSEKTTDRVGAGLTWSGSTQYIPDMFTDTWPPPEKQGRYYQNRLNLPKGKQLVQQVMPTRDGKIIERRIELDKAVCNVWLLPVEFLNLRATSYKYDSTELNKAFKKHVKELMCEVCDALEYILNNAFKRIDSMVLQAGILNGVLSYATKTGRLASTTHPDPRTPDPTAETDLKQVRDMRSELRKGRRYKVNFSVSGEATLAELEYLRRIGVVDDAIRGQLMEKFTLQEEDLPKLRSIEEMIAMDGIVAPPAPGQTGTKAAVPYVSTGQSKKGSSEGASKEKRKKDKAEKDGGKEDEPASKRRKGSEEK